MAGAVGVADAWAGFWMKGRAKDMKKPGEGVSLLSRYKGALLGLACGDALGAPVEFRPRGSFAPVQGMIAGGKFSVRKGQWTDDTFMAHCLAESLLNSKGFDPQDQLHLYQKWRDTGYLSSKERAFGIGRPYPGL